MLVFLMGYYPLAVSQSQFYSEELAVLNLEEDELTYFQPRIGAGVRWRFLYVEGGTGPNPLHGGLIWQWSARKTRKS